MTHLVQKFRVAELVGRIRGTRFHVVLQAKSVADLMRQYILQQAAHERVGERKRLRSRIERADLNEVPVANQVHYVVIELNVRLEDFTGARIRNMRARG